MMTFLYINQRKPSVILLENEKVEFGAKIMFLPDLIAML